MATARYAWGIDVGNRALKAVRLVRDGDQLRIDDFDVIEHDTVLSNSGDNREALIQASLASFVQRHDVRGGAVAIGVSGQQSFARFIKLPPVEPRKIPEIVRFEAIQQIPFPLDDVEWSYQLFQGGDSPDVEVGIFAMRKELINRHIQYFTDVDLNVQVVQMNPLAVYNAMYYDNRLRGTTMIIDLGAENTDLIIASDDSVWLRSIPIGGNNFTEALVKAFKLNFSKAEELKRNAATSKYARQIFQAMRPVFADLVAEVQRSIGFYASVHREAKIRKIIALGGTFRLPGLQKYMQQNLQVDVDRIDRLGVGVPDDTRLAAAFNENVLSSASAYGLALQAMDEGRITSSLLPQHIRRARMWQEKTKWFAAAAALVVLGTGLAFGRGYYDRSLQFESDRAQANRTEITRTLEEARRLDQEWSQIQQAGSADRQRIQNVRSLVAYRDLWPNLLVDLHAALPEPQPELRTNDPEQIRRIPRGERNVILIDNIMTQYMPDMQSIIEMDEHDFKNQAGAPGAPGAPRTGPRGPMGGGFNPYMMDPGMYDGMYGFDDPSMQNGAPTGQTRGFLITITGTTPNREGFMLVQNTLIANLLGMDQEQMENNGRNFYIARATIQSADLVRRNNQRVQLIQQTYNAIRQGQVSGQGFQSGMGGGLNPYMGGGFNPYMGGFDDPGMYDPGMYDPGMFDPGMGMQWNGGGQPAQPGQPTEEEIFADRLTGESVLDDHEFTVLVAVVIDPPPKVQDATAVGY